MPQIQQGATNSVRAFEHVLLHASLNFRHPVHLSETIYRIVGMFGSRRVKIYPIAKLYFTNYFNSTIRQALTPPNIPAIWYFHVRV